MSDAQVIAVCMGMTLFMGLVIASLVYIARTAHQAFPPYRRVLKRYPATDGQGGEIVELECGHGLRLIHNQRQSFPCEECKEKEGAR